MSTDSTRWDGLSRVVFPGDDDWDGARSAWNLSVDQRPSLVVLPGDADETARAVAAAAEAGLRIAVQGTGHGAGARSDLQDAVLINMARMRHASVDPDRRTARVDAGAQWCDVVPLAAEHGLVALHGSAPDVGVVGYTLGGGIGWLARRLGLACNAVTAVELVLPDGSTVRVDHDHDPDLFWALRGGGGGFGVVTAIEFSLHPVDRVHAGWLIWPWERAHEVLTAWARWTGSVPEEVTSVGRILQLPPLPELPEAFRGRKLVVVEAAMMLGEEEAEELLAPLRALGPESDTFATAPPATVLPDLHMDPPEPVPGLSGAGLLDALPSEAIDALVGLAGPGSGSPLLSVEVRHCGGALSRPQARGGALGALAGEYVYYAVGLPMEEGLAEAITARATAIETALSRWGSGRRYLNFTDRPVPAEAMFDASALVRLRSLRERVDPTGAMLPNHRLDPAPTAI